MANRHYANIGDVWKHLLLAQMLHAEQPGRYWESHAGDAVYRLEPDPARDYGLLHFLRVGSEVPILKESVYYRLAARFVGNDPALYGGSPALSLSLLGETDTDFLFCDVEADSIMNIRMMSPKLGVPPERLRLVHGDGLEALRTAARAARPEDVAEALAFLDPVDPLEACADHPRALELFAELSRIGVQTLLWYGYGTEAEQQAFHAALAAQLKQERLDPVTHNLWIGEIRLMHVRGFEEGFDPGVLGCGLLCANLSSSSLTLGTQLGQALERIYAGVMLPNGQRGDLTFTHAAFGK
jgi:23S rRNA A2030 N6-methylase RlmJ